MRGIHVACAGGQRQPRCALEHKARARRPRPIMVMMGPPRLLRSSPWRLMELLKRPTVCRGPWQGAGCTIQFQLRGTCARARPGGVPPAARGSGRCGMQLAESAPARGRAAGGRQSRPPGATQQSGGGDICNPPHGRKGVVGPGRGARGIIRRRSHWPVPASLRQRPSHGVASLRLARAHNLTEP